MADDEESAVKPAQPKWAVFAEKVIEQVKPVAEALGDDIPWHAGFLCLAAGAAIGVVGLGLIATPVVPKLVGRLIQVPPRAGRDE